MRKKNCGQCRNFSNFCFPHRQLSSFFVLVNKESSQYFMRSTHMEPGLAAEMERLHQLAQQTQEHAAASSASAASAGPSHAP